MFFSFLAFVSGFNKRCFLRSRCSMEMWCPDDIGRDSWDWVGPPAWGRAYFNSPEWGGGSSPAKTEPPQIVLLLLLFGRNLWVCVCPQHHSHELALSQLRRGGRKKAALSGENAANCQKWSTCRNNVQISTCKTRWKDCNRKHQLCTLLHSTEWRKTPQDSSLPQRRKNWKLTKASRRHVSTVDPSSASVTENPYAVLHRQHPNTGQAAWTEGEGKVQILKCEQRDSGHVKHEILPKASITDQQHPSTVSATMNQDPEPRCQSQLSPRSTYWPSRHYQRGLEPSSTCQRFSPVSLFQK